MQTHRREREMAMSALKRLLPEDSQIMVHNKCYSLKSLDMNDVLEMLEPANKKPEIIKEECYE